MVKVVTQSLNEGLVPVEKGELQNCFNVLPIAIQNAGITLHWGFNYIYQDSRVPIAIFHTESAN